MMSLKARGLLSAGGMALLLALPGAAFAQSPAPVTGAPQTGTQPGGQTGSQPTGTAGTQNLGTMPQNNNTSQPLTNPSVSNPSVTDPSRPANTNRSYGLGENDPTQPQPLRGLDAPDSTATPFGSTPLGNANETSNDALYEGLYGRTPATDPLNLSAGGTQAPGSQVQTPSTDTNGMLNGTGGSSIPGMNESVPPPVQLPTVPSTGTGTGTSSTGSQPGQ